MTKKHTDKDILVASSEYDALVENELNEIDKQIELLNIEVPDSLTSKLEKDTELSLRGKKIKNHRASRIASIVILFFILGITLLNTPKIVTAFRNIIRSLIFEETKESVEISLSQLPKDPYGIAIPENFEFVEMTKNMNLTRLTYQNDSEYIEITLYTNDYKVVFDNEEYELFDDIVINGYAGKIHEINSNTTVILDFDGNLIEIESNLSKDVLVDMLNNIKNEN